jgi:hypothetical protein
MKDLVKTVGEQRLRFTKLCLEKAGSAHFWAGAPIAPRHDETECCQGPAGG